MKKINILITGAGSGVGQSIIRSLIYSKIKKNLNLFISDITNFNPYPIYGLKYLKIPKVENKNSKKILKKIIIKNKINIVFIGSEYEIGFFQKNKQFFEKLKNLKVCVSNLQTISLSNDKFKTYEFLKKHNLPYPKTLKINQSTSFNSITKKIKKPFILKNRFGTSSRNVFEINNLIQFKTHLKSIKYPLVQEKLIPCSSHRFKEKEEFTCSFFTLKNKDTLGPFVARRILKFGTSWVIDVNNSKSEIIKLIKKISKKIDNLGSFNIQLINTKKGPTPFEFNSRFSGTTSISSKFGFNEPEFFIKDNFLKNKLSSKKIKIKNGNVLRYIAEKVI